LPLIERKKQLRRLIRSQKWPLLYLDHIKENGSGLFEHDRALDLGIIAKRKDSHFHVTEKGSPYWIKIKNPTYSQSEGRQELFEAVTSSTQSVLTKTHRGCSVMVPMAGA